MANVYSTPLYLFWLCLSHLFSRYITGFNTSVLHVIILLVPSLTCNLTLYFILIVGKHMFLTFELFCLCSAFYELVCCEFFALSILFSVIYSFINLLIDDDTGVYITFRNIYVNLYLIHIPFLTSFCFFQLPIYFYLFMNN